MAGPGRSSFILKSGRSTVRSRPDHHLRVSCSRSDQRKCLVSSFMSDPSGDCGCPCMAAVQPPAIEGGSYTVPVVRRTWAADLGCGVSLPVSSKRSRVPCGGRVSKMRGAEP